MKKKRIFLDPGFWILVGINAYLVYHYYQDPTIFTTLIWLYWCQSVMMGLFNFVDMLTVRTVENEDKAARPGKLLDALNSNNNAKGDSILNSKVPSSIFFAVHYGFFHLVYLVFIASMKRTGQFQWDLFKYFLIAFFFGQIFTFIQHKIQQRTHASNLGRMFFLPYLRIIPMHLTILVPAFLHVSAMGIFLILKAFADVIMYVITKPSGSSREADQAMMVTQQSLNT